MRNNLYWQQFISFGTMLFFKFKKKKIIKKKKKKLLKKKKNYIFWQQLLRMRLSPTLKQYTKLKLRSSIAATSFNCLIVACMQSHYVECIHYIHYIHIQS